MAPLPEAPHWQGLQCWPPQGRLSVPGAGLTHPVVGRQQPEKVTSLISLILEPPLPIRDPHWLAGTTSLSVTGGLLVAGLLLIELMMSWGGRETWVGLPGTHQSAKARLGEKAALWMGPKDWGARLPPPEAHGQWGLGEDTNGNSAALSASLSNFWRLEQHWKRVETLM